MGTKPGARAFKAIADAALKLESIRYSGAYFLRALRAQRRVTSTPPLNASYSVQCPVTIDQDDFLPQLLGCCPHYSVLDDSYAQMHWGCHQRTAGMPRNRRTNIGELLTLVRNNVTGPPGHFLPLLHGHWSRRSLIGTPSLSVLPIVSNRSTAWSCPFHSLDTELWRGISHAHCSARKSRYRKISSNFRIYQDINYLEENGCHIHLPALS